MSGEEVRPQPGTGVYLPITGEYATIKSGGLSEGYSENSGPSASISWILPSHARSEFLAIMFGKWAISKTCGVEGEEGADDNGEPCIDDVKACCYYPEKVAKPYNTWFFGPSLENTASEEFYANLWPVSYSMKPVDSSSTVYQVGLQSGLYKDFSDYNDNSVIQYPPFEYACPGSDGKNRADSLMVQLDIKYGWKIGWTATNGFKWIGSHPTSVDALSNKCKDPNDLISIPANTYLQYAQRPKVEMQAVGKDDQKFSFLARQSGYGWDMGAGQLHEELAWDGFEAGLIEQIPNEQQPGILFQTMQIDITWANLPQYPEMNIEKCRGKVNSESFLGYPKHSLYFLDGDVRAKASIDSSPVYDAKYTFMAKTSSMPLLQEWIGEEAEGNWYKGKIGLWNRRWHATGELGTIQCLGNQIQDCPPGSTEEECPDYLHPDDWKHGNFFVNHWIEVGVVYEGDEDILPDEGEVQEEAKAVASGMFYVGSSNTSTRLNYSPPYEEADFSRLFDYNSRCCIVPDDEEEEEE